MNLKHKNKNHPNEYDRELNQEQSDAILFEVAKESGERLKSDWGELKVISDEYGCQWLYSGSEKIICQVFNRSEDETELEVIKKGYGFVIINGNHYYFES